MIKKLIIICGIFFLTFGGCKLTGLNLQVDEVDTDTIKTAEETVKETE